MSIVKLNPEPLVLYSAYTKLAYLIGERFYGHKHYVWCTPYVGGADGIVLPPSSNPMEIYRGLLRDVREGDKHSAKIDSNRLGILNGSQTKLAAEEITQGQADEISAIVQSAETQDFSPMIFVIPYQLSKGLLLPVPVADRAHPLSPEFIIQSLPRDHFDVIDPLGAYNV